MHKNKMKINKWVSQLVCYLVVKNVGKTIIFYYLFIYLSMKTSNESLTLYFKIYYSIGQRK